MPANTGVWASASSSPSEPTYPDALGKLVRVISGPTAPLTPMLHRPFTARREAGVLSGEPPGQPTQWDARSHTPRVLSRHKLTSTAAARSAGARRPLAAPPAATDSVGGEAELAAGPWPA